MVFRAGQEWTIDTISTGGHGGLAPRSGTRIIIEDGAVLKVKPNNSQYGRLIDIGRDGAVQNVTVEGTGTLLGDVTTHTGSGGEWGHLIHVTGGSSNIQLVGPMLLKQAWGDGVYIGDGSSINYDVLIDGLIVEDCRREGIAAFWVDGCTIRNCHIFDIGLTAVASNGPGSGIDAEPNSGETVNYLTIDGNLIENTAGCGMYISSNPGLVTNLVIRDNELDSCGARPDTFATTYEVNGIHVAAIARPVLLDNVVRGSGYDGNPNGTSGQIYLRSVTRPVVKGGYIYGGAGRGIYATQSTQPDISGVTVQNNQYHGILTYQCDDARIHGNSLIDNVDVASGSVEHVSVQQCNNAVVKGNIFHGSKGHSWVRIETSGNDNTVCDNIGTGAAPASGMLVDEGTRTKTSNNKRADTSVFTYWTSNDAAAMTAARANADLLGQTYDCAEILSGTILPAAATVYLCRIPLYGRTLTITNILCYLSAVGNTLTNAFVALFKSDGTIAGQSADQSTAWGAFGTTGVQTIALASPATVVPKDPDDFVWVALYVGAATTLPTFARGVNGNSAAINAGQSTSRRRFASIAQASVATLASITPGSTAAASNAYWMAVS